MDLFRLMFEKRTSMTHFYSCFSIEGSKLTVTIEPPFRGTLGHQAISMHSSSLKLLHMGKKGRALYRCLLLGASSIGDLQQRIWRPISHLQLSSRAPKWFCRNLRRNSIFQTGGGPAKVRWSN